MARKIGKVKMAASIPEGVAERIRLRADREKRDVSSLLSYLIEKAMEGWEDIPPADVVDDREQLQEFVKLLAGARPRNGLSLTEIADITGLPARQVEELYQLVEQCRNEQHTTKQ